MRRIALVSLILLSAPVAVAAEPPPVIVELYTAQGCTSCDEANAFVGRLAERPGVLPLTFPVDYWDYLGWEDTFAQPAFAERQRGYVAKLALREPYTPQVVIDGTAETAAVQAEKVEALIEEAQRRRDDPPDMAFIGERRVDVGYGRAPKGGAEVWLIRFDPREQDVVVKKGDNRGKTVEHRNVVREMTRLGAWRGRPTAYRIPDPAAEGLQTLVLVQDAATGRIIGAARKAEKS